MSDLKKTLQYIDKKYQGKDDILGKNIMTLANKLNSSRALMHSGQLDQVVNLLRPEQPGVYTNYERAVGSYSSAYYKAEDNYVVVDKIVKFPDFKESVYTLIVKNKRTGEYDVLIKKPGIILTETYGYKLNNDKMDKLKKGDKIKKGQILYRSTSFDNNMNYRLGVNAKTLYTLHHLCIEDAIVISQSLADKLISIEYDKVYIPLNDNDILLNTYGNKKQYVSFPNIGEEIKDAMLAATRRLDYSKAFFDLKEENMRKVLSSDTPYYIPFSKDKIVDISIYSNKPVSGIPETEYNKQVIYYLRQQENYYMRLEEALSKIIDEDNYSDDLGDLYIRSSRILNPEYYWSDQGKKVFNNIIVEFFVEKEVGVTIGSKLCGRYGAVNCRNKNLLIAGIVNDLISSEVA
jgi:DNA-directed RNA polymerase, beta subunit/140 kD subunit